MHARCTHTACPFVNLDAKASLPELSPKQLKKLKQLTIVSLAQKEKIVSYTALQESLDITNLRELEDLVIESMYAVRDNDRCFPLCVTFHSLPCCRGFCAASLISEQGIWR